MANNKPTYEELNKKVSELDSKLKERVKELYCISELSKLAETKGNSDDMITKLVHVLKESWQFPEITEVRITHNGFSAQTENFKQTDQTMHSDIVVEGKTEGEIHIAYLEKISDNADPFLKEEYDLLHIVSKQLGKIIERLRFQQFHIESKNRLELIIQGSNDAPWDWDLVKDEVYFSPQWRQQLGYSSNELKTYSKLWEDLIHPDDKRIVDKVFKDALKTGKENFEVEFRLKHTHGHYVHLYSRGGISYDETRKPIRVAGSNQDLSQRKKVEQALKESEWRFRTMFLEAPLGIALVNSLNGKIYEVNQKFADIAGRTREEMSTIDWMSITHPDDVQEDLDNMSLLNAGKTKGFNMQKRYIKPDDSVVWINMTITPIIVEDKQEPRHLCMIEDITKRKNSEQALKESEAKFKDLFDRVNDAIFIYDPETFEILESNNATSKIYGYTHEELLGMSCLTFSTEVNQSKITSKKAKEKGPEMVQIRHHVRKDGRQIIVELFVSKIRSNNKDLMFAVSRDITDRLETIRIKESEARFKNMFLRHNATMLLIEPEAGSIVDANDAAVKFYGYSKSTLCSLNIEDLNTFSPDQIARERKNALNHNRNHFVFPHKLANGEIRTVEVHSSPIEYQNKRVLFSIIYDITKRKEAEQAIEESERKLKIWINNSPACTKIVDPDFNLQFISDRGVRELKIADISEFYGKPYPFYFYPDSFKELMQNNMKKVKETGETITQEASVLDVNGNELWYRSTIVPVFKAKNKLGYFLIVSLEITERRKAELAVRNSLIDLKLAQNIARIGNWQFDPQIGVPVWSDQVYKIFERDPALGPPHINEHFNYFDKEQFEIFNTAVLKAVQEAIPYDIELKLNSPGSKTKWIRSICIPQEKKSDAGYFLRGTIQDITSIKNYEIALKENESRLEALNADKDKFMSILAHDLRTPFNSLIGFSQLLSANLRNYDIDKIENQINIIYDISNKTYQLLEDILLWSRAQSGKIVFIPDVYDFHDVCKFIAEESNNRALSKGISLICKVSDSLRIFSDINLLKTVMRNLVSNAIKFTPSEGTITIDAEERENEIVVSIADTGVGINKHALPKLFNVTSKNTTSGTNNEKGTGLGLQICKEFVEKQKGRIWVESEVGKGSVFYFTIPKHRN